MKQIAWTVLAWLLLIMAPTALASEQNSCTGKPLTEARTVSELPSEVRSSLGLAKGPRRFVIAGLNANCVLVELELGGGGYSVELLVFEFISGKWQMTQRQDIGDKVLSLRDLVVNQKNAAPHLKIAEVLSIARAELQRQSVDVSRMSPGLPIYDQERKEWRIFFADNSLEIDGDLRVRVKDVTKTACIQYAVSPVCI